MGCARCILTHTVVSCIFTHSIHLILRSVVVSGSIPNVQVRKCLIGAGGCRRCNRGSWEYLDELMAPKLHRVLTRLRFATFDRVYHWNTTYCSILCVCLNLISSKLQRKSIFHSSKQLSNLPNRRKKHYIIDLVKKQTSFWPGFGCRATLSNVQSELIPKLTRYHRLIYASCP